jgi:hypothetical protein
MFIIKTYTEIFSEFLTINKEAYEEIERGRKSE